jgi:NADH-quinone oxidoreductase subunit G
VFINPARHEYLHAVAGYIETGIDLVAGVRRLLTDSPDTEAAAILARLRGASRAVVLIGQIAGRHPRFADLRQAAGELARAHSARIGYLSEGANSAGLALAGVLPHRGPGGLALARAGRNLAEMLAQPPAGLVLLNVEPEDDVAESRLAVSALAGAGFVVALSPFLSPSQQAHADVILPVGTFLETAGTFVNCEGRWQTFNGVATPVGACRPAWKVLRVLGNLLQVPDFDYSSAAEICAAVRALSASVQPDNTVAVTAIPPATLSAGLDFSELDVPMYRTDGILRRAPALQLTQVARG